MKKHLVSFGFLLIVFLASCSNNEVVSQNTSAPTPTNKSTMEEKVIKTDDEWKNILSKEQYEVLRNKGTERPFTGKFDKFDEKGSYVCGGCGNSLFSSATKFDAGCGWPSFFDVVDKSKVTLKEDVSHGMRRVEVMCAKCGGHLGHVFDDGPRPTGQRYCINSVSIDFKKDSTEKK